MQAKKGSLTTFAPATQEPPKPAPVPVPTRPSKDKFQKVFVLNAEQNDQLESLCFHSKMTIQAVAIEGINMVLRSKGLPELKS